MNKKELREKLCLRYCSYYKPGKNEESACMSFIQIQRLSERKKISFEIFADRDEADREEVLRGALCVRCPFFEKDCDFASRTQGAPPCGGFILLKNLLATGRLDIDDLYGTG